MVGWVGCILCFMISVVIFLICGDRYLDCRLVNVYGRCCYDDDPCRGCDPCLCPCAMKRSCACHGYDRYVYPYETTSCCY